MRKPPSKATKKAKTATRKPSSKANKKAKTATPNPPSKATRNADVPALHPIRNYLDLLQTQRVDLIATSKADSDYGYSRVKAWNDAATTFAQDGQLADLFAKAIAAANRMLPESGKEWVERLGKLKNVHDKLLRAATRVGAQLQQSWETEGVFWLLRGSGESPPVIREGMNAFCHCYDEQEQLVQEAIGAWQIVESNALHRPLEIVGESVFFNGTVVHLDMTAQRAACARAVLKMLIEANGNWVSSTDVNTRLKNSQDDAQGVRWGRVLDELPNSIRDLIKSKAGSGYCIPPIRKV